jgi:hypothetical protein
VVGVGGGRVKEGVFSRDFLLGLVCYGSSHVENLKVGIRLCVRFCRAIQKLYFAVGRLVRIAGISS